MIDDGASTNPGSLPDADIAQNAGVWRNGDVIGNDGIVTDGCIEIKKGEITN
ncbi:hypothetical protein D3C72_2515230 [compost metagenome]